MTEVDRKFIDQLIADYAQLGKTIKEIDDLYPKEVVLNLKPGDNLQAALDSLLVTGGIINLASGLYPGVLRLTYKNKLVTINGVDKSAQIQGFKSGNNTGNIAFNNLAFVQATTPAHVQLGGDKIEMKTVAEVPSGFTFRNVDFIGPTRRAIMANCSNMTVESCSFVDYKVFKQDSQAIIGWNGSFNHVIRDCKIEAASENIMYGGSDAASEDMYPRQILIENNYFTKNFAWKGQSFNVKTLFELKNVIGLTFRGNTLDGNFQDAWGQAPAITIKSANQEGGNLNARCENILIEGNYIQNVGAYFIIIGRNDAGVPSGIMKNVTIYNNLCRLMNDELDGRAISITKGPINLNINHNTMYDNRHSLVEFYDNTPCEGLQIQNNIGLHGIYGVRPTAYGMDPTFHHNAVQVKPPTSTQPQVKLGPTNVYYPDVHADLSDHVTSDGFKVGANNVFA